MFTGDKEYFGVRVSGDSMYPEYRDKDILIVQKINDCESGQDCIVMINGNDGTFKRVKKTEEGIILQPLNPNYEIKFYSNKEIEELPIKIIGVVKEIRRTI
jgi:repressor LexA